MVLTKSTRQCAAVQIRKFSALDNLIWGWEGRWTLPICEPKNLSSTLYLTAVLRQCQIENHSLIYKILSTLPWDFKITSIGGSESVIDVFSQVFSRLATTLLPHSVITSIRIPCARFSLFYSRRYDCIWFVCFDFMACIWLYPSPRESPLSSLVWLLDLPHINFFVLLFHQQGPFFLFEKL